MSEKKTVSVRDIGVSPGLSSGDSEGKGCRKRLGSHRGDPHPHRTRQKPQADSESVQSALKAQWDITVDRRKVSVAQIRRACPLLPDALRYVGLEVKTNGRTGKAEIVVTLDRAIGNQTAVYVGKTVTDSSEIGMLLGVARATCMAVNLTLTPPTRFLSTM